MTKSEQIVARVDECVVLSGSRRHARGAAVLPELPQFRVNRGICGGSCVIGPHSWLQRHMVVGGHQAHSSIGSSPSIPEGTPRGPPDAPARPPQLRRRGRQFGSGTWVRTQVPACSIGNSVDKCVIFAAVLGDHADRDESSMVRPLSMNSVS